MEKSNGHWTYVSDGWMDNLAKTTYQEIASYLVVASCLISSALAMWQLPQKLLQIWNGSYQEIICIKHGKLL